MYGVGGERGRARGGGGGLGHRVLLVDSRTKRVKIEPYSRSGEEEEEDAAAGIDGTLSTLQRVPPPPREIEYVHVRRGPATRWVDLKGGGTAKYVALPADA